MVCESLAPADAGWVRSAINSAYLIIDRILRAEGFVSRQAFELEKHLFRLLFAL